MLLKSAFGSGSDEKIWWLHWRGGIPERYEFFSSAWVELLLKHNFLLRARLSIYLECVNFFSFHAQAPSCFARSRDIFLQFSGLNELRNCVSLYSQQNSINQRGEQNLGRQCSLVGASFWRLIIHSYRVAIVFILCAFLLEKFSVFYKFHWKCFAWRQANMFQFRANSSERWN
jgi:hypothetical protein